MDLNIVKEKVIQSLKEDMPMGDITTDSTINEGTTATAYLKAKQDGVIVGLKVCEVAFSVMDPDVKIVFTVKDGDEVKNGDIFAKIEGDARAMLKAERTALNFLQRMSGIATKTREFVGLVQGTSARIVDTRKTTPGIRYLEKYAVKMGGGTNHRFGLSDGVLIKDNHISAAGSITKAIKMAKKNIPHTIKIEVETVNLEQVLEAVEAGADIIMLDNMSIDLMKRAVKLISGRAIIEASGNVNLKTARTIAETGVNIISIGALTHTVTAMDISMEIEL